MCGRSTRTPPASCSLPPAAAVPPPDTAPESTEDAGRAGTAPPDQPAGRAPLVSLAASPIHQDAASAALPRRSAAPAADPPPAIRARSADLVSAPRQCRVRLTPPAPAPQKTTFAQARASG